MNTVEIGFKGRFFIRISLGFISTIFLSAVNTPTIKQEAMSKFK
jgi:hypothetical protein